MTLCGSNLRPRVDSRGEGEGVPRVTHLLLGAVLVELESHALRLRRRSSSLEAQDLFCRGCRRRSV